MRNKIKPKKKNEKEMKRQSRKKEKKKKEQEQHFSVALSPSFLNIIIAAFDEKRLGSIVATRAQLQNGAKNFVRIFTTLVCKFSLLLTGFCLCSWTLALFVV